MKLITKVIVAKGRTPDEMACAEPELLPKSSIRQMKRARAFFAVAEALEKPVKKAA